MKKIVISITALALAAGALHAQDTAVQLAMEEAKNLSAIPEETVEAAKPDYWKESFAVDLGVNTTQVSHWAAGGYNTLSLKGAVDAKANYTKDMMSWNNRLQMDFGFFLSDEKPGLLQKDADRIYLESKWSYRTSASSKFSYAASFDFKSQFSDTKDKYEKIEGKWDGTLKSGLLSPAYTNIALGIDWVPNEWFNMSVSPLTGGFTICTNPILRSNYGMPLIAEGGSGYRNALFQFGAQMKANFKLVINNVLKYETQAVVFTDYLSEPYFRFNWDNAIDWQLSRLIKLSFKTWMIYDPNVTIDGKKSLQFKDFLTLSFTYTIAGK